MNKKEYSEYLTSNEWLERRKPVLMRDRWICQGCLKERATQVHHLSYEHVMREFGWELISVCDACHKRIHNLTCI